MEAEGVATVVEAEASSAQAAVAKLAAGEAVAPEEAPDPTGKTRPIYNKVPQRGKAGGRPHRAILRLTAEERTTLETRATGAGLSVASYLRTAALGTSGPRARRRPTIDREALMTATAELNRVGNNLNQLARAINQGRDADELAETLAELRATATAIREALQR